MSDPLQAQQSYLAQLLEAVQRSAWFLDQSARKLDWPLAVDYLTTHAKDADLYETLAAVNERFAKLQDTLAAAMRHAALLMGEDTSTFLKVLSLFEKLGVLQSARTWQQARVVRNRAAHDYDLDYRAIADHFNTLHQLQTNLLDSAIRLLDHVHAELGVDPATDHFRTEFEQLRQKRGL